MYSTPPISPRPRLRTGATKRSFARLSLDSLPEYSSQRSATSPPPKPYDGEQPPGYHYPESADDADHEDSGAEGDSQYSRAFIHSRTHPQPPPSPFRQRHTRRSSSYTVNNSSDAYLDSLLQRSVQALELSNALLLQSSATSQTGTLSSALAQDRVMDRNLEISANFLDNRIRSTRASQEEWMDDLDQVVRGVEDLFDDDDEDDHAPISRSLPSGAAQPLHSHRRRQLSQEPRRRSSYSRPQLRLSTSPSHTSPPPRAMTQYVSVESASGDALEATADQSSIFLPSTLGLRARPHITEFRPSPRRPDALRLYHSNASTPGIIEHVPDTSYDSLPAMGYRPGRRHSHRHSPSTRSVGSVSTPSPSRLEFDRGDTPRRSGGAWSGSATAQSSSLGRSRSLTTDSRMRAYEAPQRHRQLSPPRQTVCMTPPIEESPTPSNDSSDNSPPVAYRTMESLRKILSEQPEKEKLPENTAPNDRPRSSTRPAFLPRSPSVTALASTSTATASVSRLFTRATHSTHHPPPPRVSSLKQIAPGPNVAPKSASSSGRSTPRQVAFAQLPEPYSSEGTRKGFDKKHKSKGKKKEELDPKGFWSMLFGPSTYPTSNSRLEDRVEDRVARSWARSGTGATLEDFLF